MEKTIVNRNIGGLNFFFRPNTSDIKGIEEVMGGGYRRTRPFKFDVEPGEVWLDLGAMVGGFSAYASSRGAAKVYAVEPDPEHLSIFEKNAPGVEVFRVAVVAGGSQNVMTLNRNDKRGNTWRNSIMRKWQGGSQIFVPTMHIARLIEIVGAGDLCIKMDIEGAEMPVLEWLIESGRLDHVKKLVFEWSFDVDDDLNRFRKVMDSLQRIFPNVAPAKLYEGVDRWPKTWFPACTTIFCMK